MPMSQEFRKAASDRMKAFHAQPGFSKKISDGLKAAHAARRAAGVPWNKSARAAASGAHLTYTVQVSVPAGDIEAVLALAANIRDVRDALAAYGDVYVTAQAQ